MAVATQIGRVLAGKYRLEHTLGSGGMGTVLAATHLGLGRKVALKFMRLGLLDDGAAIGRFMREARAVATLRSEHVAQVMDVEVDTEDGAPYIVMEYLEGRDLAAMLESSGVPPVVDVVSYVLQACEGLAEAHAHGIVHRDLKPANLFLTRRPDGTPLVKVLDFGVSKLNEVKSGSFRLTHPREALGSPEYMSPEQIVASPEVDSRADIWALGVILYELLTGKPPFGGASFLELGLDVTNRLHPQLSHQVPGLAPGLVTVVDRCLQKAPASRFPDLARLAAALAPHGGPDADLAAKRIARTLGVAEASDASPTVPRRGRGKAIGGIGTRGTVGLIGAALVGLVGAGAVWQWQRRPGEQPVVSPSPRPTAAVRVPAAPPPETAESLSPFVRPVARPVVPLSLPPGGLTGLPPSGIAEPPLQKALASHKRRHVSSNMLPSAMPPPERAAVEGSTLTRRGPVVTDL